MDKSRSAISAGKLLIPLDIPDKVLDRPFWNNYSQTSQDHGSLIRLTLLQQAGESFIM